MLLRNRKLMQNALILPILTIFLISGCASTKQLEIFKTEVERVPLDLQLPPVEVLEEINWLIINEANQEEVFNKLKEANIDPVLKKPVAISSYINRSLYFFTTLTAPSFSSA